jgi:hypothetical protein
VCFVVKRLKRGFRLWAFCERGRRGREASPFCSGAAAAPRFDALHRVTDDDEGRPARVGLLGVSSMPTHRPKQPPGQKEDPNPPHTLVEAAWRNQWRRIRIHQGRGRRARATTAAPRNEKKRSLFSQHRINQYLALIASDSLSLSRPTSKPNESRAPSKETSKLCLSRKKKVCAPAVGAPARPCVPIDVCVPGEVLSRRAGSGAKTGGVCKGAGGGGG